MWKSSFHSSVRSRDELPAEDEVEDSSFASVPFLFSRRLAILENSKEPGFEKENKTLGESGWLSPSTYEKGKIFQKYPVNFFGTSF